MLLIRVEPGTNLTSYTRQRESLDFLSYSPSSISAINSYEISKFPNSQYPRYLYSLRGTFLRDLIVPSPTIKDSQSPPKREIKSLKSELLYQNQMINSWIKRYSREGKPLKMEGDPELGLTEGQVRAIAKSLGDRISLIQGVSRF